MTLPSYDPPTSHRPAPPAAGAEPPPERPRRAPAVTAAAVVLLLGGAGVAAGSWLAGGGTQPQDVLPADTLGVLSLDLDPSASQKLALMTLLDKFPDLGTEGDGDIRGHLLQPLLDETDTGLDYAADIRPWLGDRMAVAAVPDEGSEEGVLPVVVLAVTDPELMAENLEDARARTDFGFAVRDGFVLVTDSQDHADDLAAAEDVLADDADFAGDRRALGDDQVALAWADLSAVERIAAAQGAPPVAPGELFGGEHLTGRVILGVHAQDDALELVGLDFSVSDTGVPSSEPTSLVHGLPEDALAALSVSGVGERAVQAWAELERTGGAEALGVPPELGLDLPDDLRTLLGTDLAVAAFGDVDEPRFGARVATEEPGEAVRLLDVVLDDPQLGLPVVHDTVDGGYVVAGDEAALDLLARADGGLGDSEAFRAAVADPDEAGAIGYVDLAAVVEQLVDRGGETAEQAARFGAVEALGFSATSTDEGGRFVLRITTR
ncbi:DUF3352 domain-containing protein [Blastococcus sp. PRF04-17]|uniref:DUF3352 domain-containing protein n=1 Tax=Blastococcus sp. PRF04-17 TaxID=2933797 RepID=UPI001FF25A70|nr:DUF3352 domain-containing protein [Blastococcus sp. PRF04-17]UOY03414.1 DUF3352 domain-containing protein [Blastococcus sp. PRF04-17]